MSSPPFEIAIVGLGKIARDQHAPTIAANEEFRLSAVVTLDGTLAGVPGFRTIADMKEALPGIQAVAICTPPRGRFALAAEALAHGLDVLLEKPPAATLGEARAISDMAARAGKVIYAAWHSREAAGVAPARAWLAERRIKHVAVTWKEDVRVWHPGQDWLWEPGIGVFDPGINALSLVSHILPNPLILKSAELRFPENKAAPIAASLFYADSAGAPVSIEFDMDQKGPQTWDIDIETDRGGLKLSHGASILAVDGGPVETGGEPEYARLYRRFSRLLKDRQSDFDLTPLRHMADAFLLGRRIIVAPFEPGQAEDR